MFKIFKKDTNTSNNQTQQNNQNISLYIKLKNELEKKFPNYDFSELAFDECFSFICKNTDGLKDAIIVSAILRQIEPTIKDVELVYSVDDQYINNIISNKIPELRVLAYKRLEEIPNEQVVFFPGFHNDFEPLYIELISRIEYLFEIKRNTKKLLSDKKIGNYVHQIVNDSSLLFLLNYLSIRDSLIVASSLDIIDIDDNTIASIYPFEDEDLKEIFDKNISMIINELSLRIQKLENVEIETSYFDYKGLCNQYKDLYERINDTLNYLKKQSKKR